MWNLCDTFLWYIAFVERLYELSFCCWVASIKAEGTRGRQGTHFATDG